MSNATSHVYLEGDKFFFDAEVYDEHKTNSFLDYEDGDMIKWTWEGKKMTGILRSENTSLGLFVIESITSC